MDLAPQSRNHLVLVVVLVLVIEDPIVEDEDEDENENVCRICVNLHDCSTDGRRWNRDNAGPNAGNRKVPKRAGGARNSFRSRTGFRWLLRNEFRAPLPTAALAGPLRGVVTPQLKAGDEARSAPV